MNDEINNFQKDKRKTKKINKKTLAVITGITFFMTSCQTINYIKNQDNKYIMIDDEKVDGLKRIAIPDCFRDSIAKACQKPPIMNITAEDLVGIEKLSLSITEEEDLKWIRYCINLKELIITINTESLGWMLNNLGFLPKLETLGLYTENGYELDNTDYEIIKYIPTLRTLKIYGFTIGPNLLENSTQIKTLVLQPSHNIDLDYQKLTFLDTLDFQLSSPYNLAISFTSEDYECLIKNGVNVTDYMGYVLPITMEINAELDNIINNLGVDKNASDQEKHDAILMYILSSLEYDKELSLMQKIGETIPEETITSFYHCGLLYGALKKDSAICGNYAALFKALANRLELKSYIAFSDNHAWNIVNIDGYEYYADATWLDEETTDLKTYKEEKSIEMIKYKNYFRLNWYLEDPTTINIYHPDEKNSHLITNLPSYIEIKPIPMDVQIVVNNLKLEAGESRNFEPTYEVKMNNHTWILSATGITIFLGILGLLNKRKQKCNHKKNNFQKVRRLK